MLSITDLTDFIELDFETVVIIARATGLDEPESVGLARQLLESEDGIALIHHMYRDHIDAPSGSRRDSRELTQSYRRFARKYPLPHAFPEA
ncbi:MAG: hypothetical protein KDH17_07075 [Rhodocyclaceae bacterium]|nr:hypothetical protein [Rhodocyclaceae bacterium]